MSSSEPLRPSWLPREWELVSPPPGQPTEQEVAARLGTCLRKKRLSQKKARAIAHQYRVADGASDEVAYRCMYGNHYHVGSAGKLRESVRRYGGLGDNQAEGQEQGAL